MLGKKLLVLVSAIVIAGTVSVSQTKAAATPQQSIGSMLNNTCVIQASGTLWCWGRNDLGQLGDGTNVAPFSIVQEGTYSSDWRYLFDSTGNHMCAIKTNGTLWCWGNNEDGQLGLGDTVNRNVPTQVGSDTTWRSGGAGYTSTCAINQIAGVNTLWCWGANGSGILGNGTTGGPSLTPVQVGSESWLNVSLGGNHACGVQTNGTLWCWGSNEDGQLGINSLTSSYQPTQVPGNWSTVDVSGDGPGSYSCALKSDQTLWCWGRGGNGEGENTLGLGVTVQTSQPQQVGAATWSSIGIGSWTACGIQVADSSLWCWGDGWLGNLGSGILDDTADSDEPTSAVTGGASWLAVSRARDHACAVRTDSTVWCWGDNNSGQLGSAPDGAVHSTPMQLELTAGGFDLPSTDRDQHSLYVALLALAAVLAAAGVALRGHEVHAAQ